MSEHPIDPGQLPELLAAAARAPFSPTLLEADEPLWGSVWQFDVIGPGYRLPAAELALLRAVRLDESWPEETSPAKFLADLHAAVAHPQAGVWRATPAGTPAIIFAAPGGSNLMTVVWYSVADRCLIAGYRAQSTVAHFADFTWMRRPRFPMAHSRTPPPVWLTELAELPTVNSLDTAILQHRRNT
jgi:hypothetical protein